MTQVDHNMSPQKEGTKVIISGKPVQMVYPLKMHGEKNPLPVKTCIEAMRGYGRCHTTRNFEPYKAYNFKEGDLAIAYSGNQQVAFRVGRQYRITPDLISDPNYQQVWASNEKHSYKELLNFQSQPNVWGLFMEPLGDYIEGRIVPFPTVEPHIFETTTKTTAASSELISTEPTNQLIHQDILQVKRGVIVHQVNCLHKMNAGLGKSIREKWPKVFANYQKKQWQLGDVQLVQVSDAPLYVANVAGQHGYGTDKRYTDFSALATGLKRVNAWATQQNLPVYIPSRLGSGLAGGCTQAEKDETWRRVQTIIETQCPSAIICSKEPLKEKNDEKIVTIVFTGNRERYCSSWIKTLPFDLSYPSEKLILEAENINLG